MLLKPLPRPTNGKAPSPSSDEKRGIQIADSPASPSVFGKSPLAFER